MKKRDLQTLVEAQAAEIADLRRRVEAVEARPIVNGVTITREVPAPRQEPDPVFVPLPWVTQPCITDSPWWRPDVIWCDTVTA